MSRRGRRLPRDARCPRASVGASSWTPDAMDKGWWWWSDDVTAAGPFSSVTAAAQQNPLAPPGYDLVGEATAPLYVPSAGYFAGHPAILTPNTAGGMRVPGFVLGQPCSWWGVLSFGSLQGTLVDGYGSSVGCRLDGGGSGELWITCAAGFSFGVPTAWTPLAGNAASYLVSIDYDGASTRLFVGVTEFAVSPGIIESPDVDNPVLGSGIAGGDNADGGWAAQGYVPGSVVLAAERSSLHAWAQGLYGVV